MPAALNRTGRIDRGLRCFALFVMCCSLPKCSLAAERASWWPFGGDDKPEVMASSATDFPSDAESPRGNPRPRVGTLPMSERNGGWLNWPWGSSQRKQQPSTQQARPFQGVRNAGRSVSQATSNAWNNTVGKLKWGGTPSRQEQYAERQRQIQQQQQAAASKKEPGFLSRLFGGESKETEGPKTVPEWMAQERPGMNK